MLTLERMSKTKKSTDRHKPSRTMRIKTRLAKVLDELALDNETSAAEEANRLIREGLIKEGLWHRSKAGQPDAD